MTNSNVATDMKKTQKSQDPSATVDKLKSGLEDGVEEMREVAAGVQKSVSNSVETATSQSTKFVKDNPGLAIASAIGFGVLVGMAFRNRY